MSNDVARADARQSLRGLRLDLSAKNTPLALVIFGLPIIGYVAAFVGILAVGWPWGVLLCPAAAWFVGMMFIVGHDACHQSFTPSRRLNGLIGRVAFIPSLHSFSLWDLGHNRIHHRHNNVRGFDYVWEPMSPSDYRAANNLKRGIYRLLRSPIGVAIYYLPCIWLPKMFLVRKTVYGSFRRAYLWDGVLVWGALALQITAAVMIGSRFGRSAIESVLLAVVVPFLIWNVLMSFVIYLHHTHPDVEWYQSVEEWRGADGAVRGTVHVRFPWLVRKLMFDIMEHNAHHFAPGVALYRLEAMQKLMPEEELVEWTWSVGAFLTIAAKCKLYDYDQHRWVTFREAASSSLNTARVPVAR